MEDLATMPVLLRFVLEDGSLDAAMPFVLVDCASVCIWFLFCSQGRGGMGEGVMVGGGFTDQEEK